MELKMVGTQASNSFRDLRAEICQKILRSFARFITEPALSSNPSFLQSDTLKNRSDAQFLPIHTNADFGCPAVKISEDLLASLSPQQCSTLFQNNALFFSISCFIIWLPNTQKSLDFLNGVAAPFLADRPLLRNLLHHRVLGPIEEQPCCSVPGCWEYYISIIPHHFLINKVGGEDLGSCLTIR